MNLKHIFDKAESGVLTYEQFTAAVAENKAKFVDLSEGGYVDKQKYTDDLAARETRIQSLDDTIKTRDADLANLRTQLENAGTDEGKLTDLTNRFNDLQKKYDDDTAAYQKRLQDQAYKYAVNEFADKQKFTSQAAKRDFINTMMAKEFKMENDVIIGASDFVTAYTKDNADAFVVEDSSQASNPAPKPHFVDPTGPQSNTNDGGPAFKFNFTGVRPREKE
jgi:small-conductance mechanosensitive channel